MNVLLMILAFLILTGIALLFCNAINLNVMEGMLMAASCIVIVLHIAAFFSALTAGMIILYILSAIGLLVSLIFLFLNFSKKEHNHDNTALTGVTTYLVFAIIFVLCIFLYFGDFMQHFDELHQWALIPKYMLQYGRLPDGNTAVAQADQNVGTSYFHYFFQRIAGYNEGMMYVSAALLYWIGFLLPFADGTRKDIRNIFLFSLIVYIALYSLHPYGSKSLYVDIPVASWTGGIIVWLNRNRDTKLRKQIILILPALFAIFNFKKSVGWMLDLFILFYFVLLLLYRRGGDEEEQGNWKIVRNILIVVNVLYTICIVFAALILANENNYHLIPTALRELLISKGMSGEKLTLTFSSFVKDLVGNRFTTGTSALNMTFLFLMILCTGLIVISRESSYLHHMDVLQLIYCLTIVYIYVSATFFGYLVRFSYNMAVDTASSRRYLSIIGIAFFTIALSQMLTLRKSSGKRQLYISLALLIIFVSGVNTKYMANTTSWSPDEVSGYADLKEVRRESEIIRDFIKAGEKVYFINQVKDFEEYAANEAIYDLFPQVSDFRNEPWQFSQKGCMIGRFNYNTFMIDNLPGYLLNKEYSYIWIYNTDPYIKEKLPEVFDMSEDTRIMKGQLYKIRKGIRKPLNLMLVKNTIRFDDRDIYEGTQ